MRVVIDTNALETDELRVFLGSARSNVAVLPEHTIVEVFKQPSIEQIWASFSILRDFPKQVTILRGNRYAGAVDPRAPAISNRFIDRDSTRSFPKFCAMLREAHEGNRGYLKQIEQRRVWARERVEKTEEAFGDQSESLAELRAIFTAEEVRRIGAGQPLTSRSRWLILAATVDIAQTLATNHPAGRPLPEAPHLYYSFTWRYTLCHLIQLINLMQNGAVRRAPAKARNDHFDNVFSTFGTYYNGLMTNDRGPLETQAVARIILRALGARLAEDYIESGYILRLIDTGP